MNRERGTAMATLEDFSRGDAEASATHPAQASALRKNKHVMLKKRPCKIVDISRAQPGKHGHAKLHIVGLDIFTGKKYEEICPSSHNMEVPDVARVEYQLVSAGQVYLSLLNDAGLLKGDVKLPTDDMGAELKRRSDDGDDLIVTVIQALGDEKVISFKANTAPM